VVKRWKDDAPTRKTTTKSTRK